MLTLVRIINRLLDPATLQERSTCTGLNNLTSVDINTTVDRQSQEKKYTNTQWYEYDQILKFKS